MKKSIIIILLAACALYAQPGKTGLKGNIGFSLYGGLNVPVNGKISSDISTTDLVNPGPHFGLGFSYFFTKNFGAEAVFNYDINIYNNKYRIEGKQPSVSVNSFSINGMYYFGNTSNKKSVLPFVRAGAGVYSWRYLDDTPWRDGTVIVNNGIEQKASSFGFNIGAGIDYTLSKHFKLGAVLDYNIYFPKDEEKFGKDFSRQEYFTPQLKLSYFLPTK